jgi:hypothetical protein
MRAQVLLLAVAIRFIVGMNAIELPARVHRELGERGAVSGEMCRLVPVKWQLSNSAIARE